jgi:hypothetical protein
MAVVMSKVFSLFLATPLCMKLFLIPLDSMKVAFHKDIMTRSVTIDGDIFEPRGLLTGGSRKWELSLLHKCRLKWHLVKDFMDLDRDHYVSKSHVLRQKLLAASECQTVMKMTIKILLLAGVEVNCSCGFILWLKLKLILLCTQESYLRLRVRYNPKCILTPLHTLRWDRRTSFMVWQCCDLYF